MTSTNDQGVFTYAERAMLVSLAVISFGLGFIGYNSYYESIGQDATTSDLSYLSVNLFFMQFFAKGVIPLTLDMARWLAPATLSYALIKTILSLVHSKVLLLKINRLSDHAVVIGLTNHSVNIAASFAKNGIKTVVVDSNQHNQYWGELKKYKLFQLVANPSDSSLLTNANLSKASYLFASTASDNTNLNLIYSAYCAKKTTSEKQTLRTICKVEDKVLLNSLNNRHLFAVDHNNMTTRTLNYKLMMARWLVNEFGPHKHIDSFSEQNSVSILIAGENAFTAELIVRLVEIGVYGVPEKIRISVVSENASKVTNEVVSAYPSIIELATIEAITIDSFDEKDYQALILKACPDIVYVCPVQTGEKLLTLQSISLYLENVPVVVCETDNQNSFEWLKSEFSESKNINFVNVNSAISHYEDVFENRLDQVAIAIHRNYVDQRYTAGDTVEKNASIVSWNELPESLKNANRNQADHIAIKSHFLTGSTDVTENEVKAALTDTNKVALAQMEHCRWITEKKLAGWQFTSGAKDTVKKLSPSLIAWNELSDEEKAKDIEAVEYLAELVRLSNHTKNNQQ